MSADDTAQKQQIGRPFKPGQSGNPAGRPRGARTKLTEDFLKDVLEVWETSGKRAVIDMVAGKPGDFVKMVAGLIPKDVNLNVNNADELSDAELAERIQSLAAALGPFLVAGAGIAPEGGESTGGAQLPSRVH